MQFNEVGRIVGDTWQGVAQRHSYVVLDEWCLMPDHFHGILELRSDATAVDAADDDQPGRLDLRKSVGRLIGAFKTISTNEANRLRKTPGAPLWQRNFWDRIIRNDAEMERTRMYIRQNAARYRHRTITVTL